MLNPPTTAFPVLGLPPHTAIEGPFLTSFLGTLVLLSKKIFMTLIKLEIVLFTIGLVNLRNINMSNLELCLVGIQGHQHIHLLG